MKKSYNVYYNLGYWFLLLIVLVIAGFYTSYFKVIFEPTDPLIHLHFTLMAIWIVMLIVQPFLIKYKKLSYHRLIGKLSYFVVPLVVLSSFFMIRFSYFKEVEAARQQAPGVTMDTWLRMAADNTAIPFFYLGWFAVFYLLAVRNKRKSAIHARYMMATALTMLGPTVDRILIFHFNLFESVGNLVFAITFLLIDLILLYLLYKDYKEQRSIKPLTTSLLIYIIGQGLFYTLPGTVAWQEFMLLIMKPYAL